MRKSMYLQDIQHLMIRNQDIGAALSLALPHIQSPYILLLQDQDYLSPLVGPSSLELDASKSVMTCRHQLGSMVIRRPFFIKTSYLVTTTFPSVNQLPFKEALIPSWLSRVEKEDVLPIEKEWIKQAKKNSSATQREKFNFLRKYTAAPHTAGWTQPTLAVIISCFNMAPYVGATMSSCFFQHAQFEQLLVIDDGSSDHSYKELEKWKGNEHVQVFQKENGGKAIALNELLTYVTTDFVLELDADDWLDPNAFLIIKEKLSTLSQDVSVLYGNFRKWKQLPTGGVMYIGTATGKAVKNRKDLLNYRFPLGPRIYRTSSLKEAGGFPIVDFEDGRLYEDVSVLLQLLKDSRFSYQDFTVYNIREHDASITKKNHSKWNDFKQSLK